jgi:hypothetical protein
MAAVATAESVPLLLLLLQAPSPAHLGKGLTNLFHAIFQPAAAVAAIATDMATADAML